MTTQISSLVTDGPQERVFSIGKPHKTDAWLSKYFIYEDDNLIAINKPAGICSQGGQPLEKSILTGLDELQCAGVIQKRHLAHRLDRYTSGVLLLPKVKSAARNIQKAFKSRNIQKTYWALIDGIPKSPSGVIRESIVQDGGLMYTDPQGRPSETEYHVLATNSNGVSFVRFHPKTGRRHQLRVHAAEVFGMPILGDLDYHPDFYSQKERKSPNTPCVTQAKNARLEIKGQMLHAFSITFQYPGKDRMLTIQAPLPKERETIWRELGFEPQNFS